MMTIKYPHKLLHLSVLTEMIKFLRFVKSEQNKKTSFNDDYIYTIIHDDQYIYLKSHLTGLSSNYTHVDVIHFSSELNAQMNIAKCFMIDLIIKLEHKDYEVEYLHVITDILKIYAIIM
jgi:hypothetical protein